MTQHLHLSIGPVQGFVSQSRRTRDLWGSSYLLSFLAAHAIKGARQVEGARIVRPRMDDNAMLRWVEGHREGEPPKLGSVPNHLVFELADGLAPSSVASAAEVSLREAWQQVCRAVWNRYVARAAPSGNGTEAIWQRQINGFWEVLWVAGSKDERGLLDRRKYWRTHWLPEEAGTKCTVMPELQEISGYVRATDSARQDAFWEGIRDQLSDLDLRENERLCAVALVKRLYARRISRDALGWEIDVRHWPSTVDVAADPWRRQVLQEVAKDAQAYAEAVARASPREAAEPQSFATLDANWFHPAYVASPRLAPLANDADRAALHSRLELLTADRGGPPIYFALLLADGDRLGEKVAELGPDAVGDALSRFTREVPKTVGDHHGVTVYAGGDDVLALIPVDEALKCARELERLYRQSFAGRRSTLSAAVVFAHARDPLNRILEEAHRLLDDVAKKENGRASLAAGVYRGTTAIQWVTTWDRPSTGTAPGDAVDCVQSVARELASQDGGLTGSLVQDLRHLLSLLCGAAPMTPGSFATLGEGIDPVALVRGEIEHRLAHQEGPSQPEDAVRLAALLGDVLGRSRNNQPAAGQVGIDGLMLAHFLAGGGREEEHGP